MFLDNSRQKCQTIVLDRTGALSYGPVRKTMSRNSAGEYVIVVEWLPKEQRNFNLERQIWENK
jgi:hypothetical protein